VLSESRDRLIAHGLE
jgi:hypothetical protein